MNTLTRVRRLALLSLLTLAVMGEAPAAHAHSGSAVFETLQAEGGSDLVIDLRLRVRYSEDNELAERAILSATATSPDGRALGKVDLEREDGGIYRAAIRVDQRGTWTIDIASAFPPGSSSLSVDVGDDTNTGLPVPVMSAVLLAVGVAFLLWRRRRGKSARKS